MERKQKPSLPHVESTQYNESNEECGWGPLKPPGCQNLRSMKLMLLCLCLSGFMQCMVVNGFINVVASTIERRFTLLSRHSGLIMSCYDIASVVVTIPVSYIGTDFHKPRILGTGVFIVGLGSFVFSLPHFLTGPYEYEAVGHDNKCLPSSNQSYNAKVCDGEGEISHLSTYRFVMMMAQFLHGCGAAPLYTIGITYLDDNLPTKMTSVYIAIFYAMTVFGAAIGYLVGSQLLQTFCDFDTVNMSKVTITTESTSWVGAWWLGFLIAGLIIICVSIPTMGFPKLMPGWKQLKANRKQEAYGENLQSSQVTLTRGVTDTFVVLLSNAVFILLSLAAAAEGILMVGYWSFAPKFIESQFSLSASTAALVVGCTAIPAGVGGLLLGGYLQKKLDLSVVGLLRMCLIINSTSIVFLLTFFVRCPEVDFAGVSAAYNFTTSKTLSGIKLADAAYKSEDVSYMLEAPCNAGCQCDKEQYYPVCGEDHLMYFSPCMAGCTKEFEHDGKMFYSACACINSNYSNGDEAKEGKCSVDCNLLTVFMTLFAVFIGLSFMTLIPAVIATLRCLPDRERTMGIGLNWIIIRCLGTIPSPIVFGSAIDRSCRLWKTPCNGAGSKSCLFYNNNLMSDYMLTIGVVCKGTACLLFITAFILYKRYDDKVRDKRSSTSLCALSGRQSPATTPVANKKTPKAIPLADEKTPKTIPLVDEEMPIMIPLHDGKTPKPILVADKETHEEIDADAVEMHKQVV